jgi:hypothetical protein
MHRRPISTRRAVISILVLQPIPLLLFPPASLVSSSQEWWLPMLLAAMILIADVELLVRRSHKVWPWHLMVFSHGFNIISRIMMMWAHATRTVGGATTLNLPYLSLTIVAMAWSAFLLWYLELPDVRLGAVQE